MITAVKLQRKGNVLWGKKQNQLLGVANVYLVF